MEKKMKFTTLVAAATVLAAGTANAAAILQPVDATSSVGSFPTGGDYDIDRTIDQSSLSAGYTSGVTDFDSYVPMTAHLGAGGASEIWYAPANVTTAVITFDLGAAYLLDGFGFWGDWQGIGQTVRDFTLTASDDAGFSSTTFLGSFAAADGNGTATDNLGQVFGFDATTASYVRMDILSNHGSDFTVGFGEAAFRISDGVVPTVPVPAGLPLALTGLIALGALARRSTST